MVGINRETSQMRNINNMCIIMCKSHSYDKVIASTVKPE